ncbi:unnamed protein product [Urochloa humidicola]
MSRPASKRLMWDFKRLQQDLPAGISSAPHDNTTCFGSRHLRIINLFFFMILGRMTRHWRPAARPHTGHTVGEGEGGVTRLKHLRRRNTRLDKHLDLRPSRIQLGFCEEQFRCRGDIYVKR